MSYDTLEEQLRRLITGLADQEIVNGREFGYDGQALYADDVADIGLPSILCIAQELSGRLGQGGLGYRFEIKDKPNPVFPLYAIPGDAAPAFFKVSPFVMEVFQGEVLDCRMDLALLFETAAQLVRPGYSLAVNTDYIVGAIVERPAGAMDTPAPGDR